MCNFTAWRFLVFASCVSFSLTSVSLAAPPSGVTRPIERFPIPRPIPIPTLPPGSSPDEREISRAKQNAEFRKLIGAGGPVTFDLSSGVSPAYTGVSADEAQRKGLNFLLNFTSKKSDLVKVGAGDIDEGKVTLSEFTGRDGKSVDINDVLNMDVFRSLERQGKVKNPYSCPGDEKETYRIDFMAATMTSPEVYYDVAGFPKTWPQLARQLGVSDNSPGEVATNFNPNRVIVDRSRITIGEGPRVLEFEERKGKLKRTVYRSYDFSSTPLEGDEEKFSDTAQHPNDFKGKAGEFIFHLDNGFLGFYLAGGNGARQDLAPADVVKNKEYIGPKTVSAHNNPQIRAPFDCLRCHSGGFIGEAGGFDIEKFTAGKLQRKLITEAEVERAKGRYVKGAVYDEQSEQDSDIFRKAMKDADAYIEWKAGKPAALLPDFAAQYKKDIKSLAQLAKELGFKDQDGKTAAQLFRAAVTAPRNTTWRKRLFGEDKVPEGDEIPAIPRKEFADLFCDLKLTLIDQEALTPVLRIPKPLPRPIPRPIPRPFDLLEKKAPTGSGHD